MEFPSWGQIGAVAARHSNQIRAASENHSAAHCNARSSTHWGRPGIEPASSWVLVRFVSAEPRQELRNQSNCCVCGQLPASGTCDLSWWVPPVQGSFYLALGLACWNKFPDCLGIYWATKNEVFDLILTYELTHITSYIFLRPVLQNCFLHLQAV